MGCKNIQKQILEMDDLSENVRGHIHGCPQCSGFLRDFQILQSIHNIPFETPKELRRKAFYAFANIQMGKRPGLTTKRFAKLFQFWRSSRFAVALSIVFIFTFIVTIILSSIKYQDNIFNNFSVSVLCTIFMQNIIMAIFIPIFFFQNKSTVMKHN